MENVQCWTFAWPGHLPGRSVGDMILPGSKDWLASSLAGNWTMLRLESDLIAGLECLESA